MRKEILLIFFILSIASINCNVEEEDGVLILTDDNFDQVAAANPYLLVELYAPWCGHCKKLTPEYASAAQTLKTTTPAVPLGKVDATVHKKLAERFKVQGFPTLKFLANGNEVEYNGGRTANEIVSWVTKRTGEVTTLLADAEAVKDFIANNEVAIIYFGESDNDSEYAAFKATAMGYDDLKFGHTSDESARTSQNAGHKSIVLFKKFDEGRNNFSGIFTAENLKAFVEEHSFANVMPFNDRAIEKVFQKQNPTLFLFSNDNEESVAAERVFERVAKSHKGEVLFSISKPNDGFGHYDRLSEYLGVDGKKAPLLVLVAVTGDVAKYRFENTITEVNVVKFVQDFKSNKLSKYLKSEDIPEPNGDAVRTVVGKNFDEVVLNSNKDVLVEFYAPWCGHCKQLAPIYEEFAQKIRSNPNIIIAQVDATANEVPSVEIKSYPTLKFWANGKQNAPIEYEGNRDLEGLTAFIKKHTTYGHDDL